MKNKIIFTLVAISLSFLSINNVSANVCEPVIDPYYDCYEEQDGTPNFADPSLEDAKKCDEYTETINKYCTKTCREEVTTKLPSTINPLSNDPNAPILSGSHFQWESSSIIVTRECEVEIDYKLIENTINEVTTKYKDGVKILIRELLQWTDNKDLGIPCGGSAEESLGFFPYDCTDPYNTIGSCTECVAGAGEKCNEIKGEAVPTSAVGDGSTGGENNLHAGYYCPTEYRDDGSVFIPKLVAEYTGASVTGANCLYYEKIKLAIPHTGTLMTTTMVYNFLSNPTYWHKRDEIYCSDQPPFYDGNGGSINIGGAVSTWTSNFNSIKAEYQKTLSYLEQCYENVTSEIAHKPEVTVNYTDPTGNYADSKTPTKILLDRNLVSESSETKFLSSVASNINTYNCNSNLPTTQAQIAAYKDNLDAAAPGNFCTENKVNTSINSDGTVNVTLTGGSNSVIYTKLYSKTTEEYTYTMPGEENGDDSVFRYVAKINGEASFGKPTPWNDEASKKYIDIGYSNYPVHVDTEEGTYPIYLDYVNVGSYNRFNWSQYNKFEDGSTNSDLHRYYVCDYAVTSPTNECLPSDPYYPTCVRPPGDCGPTDPNYPECRINECDPTVESCGTCPPGTPFCPGDGTEGGVDVIYRPIDLDDPFPDETGEGREPGVNWSDLDVDRFITNNRDVKTENVYGEEPLYSFTLTPDSIRRINDYNKITDYNDFNLDCYKETGKRCLSDFLDNIDKYVSTSGGTCLGSSWSDFYACADKVYPDAPNQDAIIGGINSNGNYECINCSDPKNATHPGCSYRK